MAQVNVHEAKSQLSALIARVLAGEQVTIARAGVPVVDLVPHRGVEIVYGLGRDEPEHDPAIFDGIDEEIRALFYDEREE
ncbi:type II toxin-antitoxin system Phd/YefM family antitoxin [Microbacterium immunditiarum]|uniref:Prevent-host-death family protein n=1 Tax=Microbacterium immunditiarum TaxID=337480 RepID=A0A7Y9GKP0_9MICO|nr:type II toxin-antitoxin system prevent-host-death family antitoxin [Microbacterium immunditiarum]NYE18256.1 prevent-host-death family protein [Microbacterium immunditiarum]